ncbi:MAG: GNAT family N-acetyltransferase [Lentisphaerae bacterium]|jgi:ribosomal protein S18 acetylase RimI-like enzyme|nr:GNAT family N-acetyltransferase [Lentisphaerota bacterium]MBT4821294.1 GNAT family N-acetyltransferase [Lentisphaerota bacterium]MBT5607782.1 GNAT family N-acetyltransferase [Lentisphaerota bacterium]MBT7061762.1 GNAT family N-acetyltransferase [Lentisphaerota bacterium]MBT7843978.1 GNAT family N-acetyltransferase [Lentisphaerota bacterium]
MIRDYRHDDLPRLMDIGNRAWAPIYDMFSQAYGTDLFERIVSNRQTDKGDQIRNHCRQHPEWVYVCEESGEVVGFVTFRIDWENGVGAIGNNARDPECEIKGVGQHMYSAVLDRFREEGLTFAKVTTGMDAAHAPARKAYEAAGFDRSHQDVTYYCKL